MASSSKNPNFEMNNTSPREEPFEPCKILLRKNSNPNPIKIKFKVSNCKEKKISEKKLKKEEKFPKEKISKIPNSNNLIFCTTNAPLNNKINEPIVVGNGHKTNIFSTVPFVTSKQKTFKTFLPKTKENKKNLLKNNEEKAKSNPNSITESPMNNFNFQGSTCEESPMNFSNFITKNSTGTIPSLDCFNFYTTSPTNFNEIEKNSEKISENLNFVKENNADNNNNNNEFFKPLINEKKNSLSQKEIIQINFNNNNITSKENKLFQQVEKEEDSFKNFEISLFNFDNNNNNNYKFSSVSNSSSKKITYNIRSKNSERKNNKNIPNKSFSLSLTESDSDSEFSSEENNNNNNNNNNKNLLIPNDLFMENSDDISSKNKKEFKKNKKFFREGSYNNGRWQPEEHKRFIEAIFKYGNEWKLVQKYVGTRSSTQARSHAQKFFVKMKRANVLNFNIDISKNSIKTLHELANSLNSDEYFEAIKSLNCVAFEKKSDRLTTITSPTASTNNNNNSHNNGHLRKFDKIEKGFSKRKTKKDKVGGILNDAKNIIDNAKTNNDLTNCFNIFENDRNFSNNNHNNINNNFHTNFNSM